jgi:hypothetical protein
MKEAINQIVEALEQQMEFNFFVAAKLVELYSDKDRGELKEELHAKISLLRESNLKAVIALDDLVEGKTARKKWIPMSRLREWIRRDIQKLP